MKKLMDIKYIKYNLSDFQFFVLKSFSYISFTSSSLYAEGKINCIWHFKMQIITTVPKNSYEKSKCSLPGLHKSSRAPITHWLKHFSSRLLAAFLLTCWLYSRAVISDTNVTTNLCICVDTHTQNILTAIEKELFLPKAIKLSLGTGASGLLKTRHCKTASFWASLEVTPQIKNIRPESPW